MNKVIFVVAPPHSGTTILYKMLGKHPEVTWFSQYSMRGGKVPGRFRLPFYKQIDRFLRKHFAYSWDKRGSSRSKLIPRPSEPHKIWDHLLPDEKEFFTADDYTDKQARQMQQFVNNECQVHGKETLITKLPRLSRAVKLLEAVFPQSRFIHIVRDGKAVALSNRSKFYRHTDSKLQALEDSANYWKKVVQYIREARAENTETYMTVRYEDMCADVHGTLKAAADHLGVSSDGLDMQQFPKSLQATNDKHFQKCTDKEKRMLNDILAGLLREYDYKPFPPQ